MTVKKEFSVKYRSGHQTGTITIEPDDAIVPNELKRSQQFQAKVVGACDHFKGMIGQAMQFHVEIAESESLPLSIARS